MTVQLVQAEGADDLRATSGRTPLSSAQRDALALLMSRRSRWPLAEPAPTQAELDLVIDLALRAPDHGRLQPWRFTLVRGEARHALGEVFVRAAKARDPDAAVERFRAKATASPLIIVMGAQVQAGHKVPEIEQILTVGAASMNMLNALHVLGYGGFWTTGANAYDEEVKRALGFRSQDWIVGFLHVGTPRQDVGAVERPARERFVREWPGPQAGGRHAVEPE